MNGRPVYAGTPAGYVISAAGSAVFYHTGDTDVFSDMGLIAALHAPRIVALPIGGHYTMGPRAAAVAIEMLRPRCVIPMHFGTWPQLPGTAVDFRAELIAAGAAGRAYRGAGAGGVAGVAAGGVRLRVSNGDGSEAISGRVLNHEGHEAYEEMLSLSVRRPGR